MLSSNSISPFGHSFAYFIYAFSYHPSAPGQVEWYVNFADSRLFGFYEGHLFAQDEMQVMEHPCLGSIRDALAYQIILEAFSNIFLLLLCTSISEKDPLAGPYTRGKGHFSTPILIKGNLHNT